VRGAGGYIRVNANKMDVVTKDKSSYLYEAYPGSEALLDPVSHPLGGGGLGGVKNPLFGGGRGGGACNYINPYHSHFDPSG
jgi:hypothetical protein